MSDFDFSDLIEDTPAEDQPHVEDSDPLLSSDQLAAWLGLKRSRVTALARQGVLPRVGQQYPHRACILAYCEHIRAGAVGRKADPDLAAEKLRLAREQADKLAIANAKARDDLVSLAEVEREWTCLATDLRARLLAIGPRVASAAGLDRATAARIDAELRDALEGIADDH